MVFLLNYLLYTQDAMNSYSLRMTYSVYNCSINVSAELVNLFPNLVASDDTSRLAIIYTYEYSRTSRLTGTEPKSLAPHIAGR